MKFYGIMLILLLLILLIVPTMAIKGKNEVNVGGTGISEEDGTEAKIAAKNDEEANDDAVMVFRSDSGKVEEIDTLDYLCGAVAAEISPEYGEEAIKAQAVACHTYALYMKSVSSEKPDGKLEGADLSDSSKTHQGYISEEEQREKWGDKYDEYSKKIKKAVKQVTDKAMTYDGKYIMAAFHAVNTGMTEDAKNIWGASVPYLVCVSSAGDTLCADYLREKCFSADEMKKVLKDKEIEVSGDAEKWFGETKSTQTGTVTEIEICGEYCDGGDVRDALSLCSGVYTVEFSDGGFTVQTRGYGHMVGMSQCGAAYMARQGSTWEEILLHYYRGVTIVTLE